MAVKLREALADGLQDQEASTTVFYLYVETKAGRSEVKTQPFRSNRQIRHLNCKEM